MPTQRAAINRHETGGRVLKTELQSSNRTPSNFFFQPKLELKRPKMSRGRKPKPARLHYLEGTARPHRINDNQPLPKIEKPDCPSYLPAKARTAFKELRDILADEMRVLTKADRWALIMLADAWNDYREAQRILEKEGNYYKTLTNEGNELLRRHPMVAIRNDAWERTKSMLSEFGCTPSSRRNVSAQSISDVIKEQKPKKW